MKYFTLFLMLMASYSLAELPSINDDNLANFNDRDPAIDLILLMLQQLKGDVAELTVKTNSLLATTDSLQTTVAGLSLKVRNMEEDIRNNKDDITDLKNTVETGTSSMDPAIQQQITELSSDVTALTEESEGIQQQVVDLSSKEQNDYDELNADITALNSTIQANYQELKGDVDNIVNTCGPLNNGYKYEWVDTEYSWNNARTNCQSKGGDLAYHGLDTLNGREQLLCGYFNLCDNGGYSGEGSGYSGEGSGDEVNGGTPWFGLSRNPTTGRWEYLNGEYSPFDDQLWFSLGEYDDSEQGCAGLWGIEYNDPYFLQAYSWYCDDGYQQQQSICEFRCF